MSVREAPCPLPEYVHGHGQQHHPDSDAANDEEALADALGGDPVVDIKGHAEGEHVLDEVHSGEGLGRHGAMRVGHVGHNTRRPQLHAEVDEAHTHDDGDRPGVLAGQALAPGEEARHGEEEVGHHDG
ncbi:hypothetical protein PG990_008061 [Apiospora arundinis]